ncbi:filamentous hemagglutinin N-terminal domain-containing protein [Pseudoxanthomonas sp. J35]|uniref:two-partner secretion domain-containing protein n=1 Tax=Pseudoxanthomonas sp. J35 TaxID=935852 RepID=UPI0004ACEE7D|nr:filamentous hemagglutinin N-terminal domain-containing protein [Pseudoxanthomonas sp. J35]
MHTRPERVPSRSRRTARTCSLALLALLPALAMAQDRDALPEDGRVVAGKAELSRKDRTLTISQQTRRAILEWSRFDIGADAAVRFVQPSSTSVALNRVLGGDPSRIAGSLSANGHVYLVNPAGVLFAPGARVDAAQLVTSTLDIADGEFLAGREPLPGIGSQWQPPLGGSIPALMVSGLLAATTPADDAGTMDVQDGEDAASPGGLLTLDAGADGHLRIGLDAGQMQALIDGGGLQQEGEEFVLSADGDNDVAASAVAAARVPQARGTAVRNGRLLLVATPAPQEEAALPAAGGSVRRMFADDAGR